MTESKTPVTEELARLRREEEALEKPDRAIPLPKSEDEDDGVGPITGTVP